MKRILCLLAAMAMVLILLAGCRPPFIITDPGPGPYHYNHTVTFTTVRPLYSGVQLPDGWTLYSNPFNDYMKTEINASFIVNWEDSNYDNHLLMDLAANTMADVFYVPDYNMFMQLYQANVLADLQDALNRYASQWLTDTYASYDQAALFGPIIKNGQLLALPSTANGYQQDMLWVRQDWLDTLGLPQPKTIDDIASTALAFMRANPGGAAAPVGINVNSAAIFGGYGSPYGLDPVANAMGAYPGAWIKNADGQIVYGSIQPEFKQVLAKVRGWVQQGIVDPNCFTQSWTQIANNPIAGATGLWFSTYVAPDIHFIQTNPDAQLSVYAAPLNINGDGKSDYIGGNPLEGMLCVRKDYLNPDVVLRTFDVSQRMLTDPTYAGYEALQPMRDSGIPWYVLAPLGQFAVHDDRAIITIGEQVKNYIDSGVLPPVGAESNRFIYSAKAWADGSGSANNWVDWMTYYVAAPETADPVFNKVTPAFFGQTPTMMYNWADLQDMEQTMIQNILTGAADVNSFDVFVTAWKTEGGDAITAEVNSGQ
ncbi:MAG: extracellular solute-binding protein [Oscillospiraceae bacterium]|nr:extracellular solute-binding protein [Oscillospiraceae bacterium]